MHFPEIVSYSLIDPSSEQEANVAPFGENRTLVIGPEWWSFCAGGIYNFMLWMSNILTEWWSVPDMINSPDGWKDIDLTGYASARYLNPLFVQIIKFYVSVIYFMRYVYEIIYQNMMPIRLHLGEKQLHSPVQYDHTMF